MGYTVNCNICGKKMEPNESLPKHIYDFHPYHLDIFFEIIPNED